MPKIVYEERVVAFIDVLGFKEFVKQSVVDPGAMNKLEDLVGILETTIPRLNKGVREDIPTHLIPRHTYISDCIILSAPVSDPNPAFSFYNGLSVITMRAIQLTHRFLKEGYLLRGGISVGPVMHSAGNIIGPAYQEAYMLEDQTDKPRIVLSDTAAALWRHDSDMCLSYDNALMVNGLHDYYLPQDVYFSLEYGYWSYLDIIEQQIHAHANSPHIKEKWMWYSDYIRECLPNLLHSCAD